MFENTSSYFFVGVPVLLIVFFVVSGSVHRRGSGIVKKKNMRTASGNKPASYDVSIFDIRTGELVEYEILPELYFKILKNEEIRFRYRYGVITALYLKNEVKDSKMKEAHV